MAKDDYFRIVYVILKFLYSNMKKGNINVSIDEVIHKSDIPDIHESYFNEIIKNLIEDGYVDFTGTQSNYIYSSSKTIIEALKIKPKGIEYLEENSMMKKIAKIIEVVK
nr:MAG TPA: YjcQ protein [Caudoviricetes sp.]